MLFAYTLFGPTAAADEEMETDRYQLGWGYPLKETPLTLGGYASLKYLHLDNHPAKSEISDLSLFINWDGGIHWKGFSEVEIGEALVYESGKLTTADAKFEIERAYLEYEFNDRFGLRIGKSLTPIGHWNSLHADPLIWTVTRPLTTDAGFSHYVTGLTFKGGILSETGFWRYQFFLDNSADLDPKPDNPTPTGELIPGVEVGAFDHAVGGRVQFELDNERWQIGVSGSRFRLEGFSGYKTLFSVDFLWRPGRLELLGEGVYREDSKDGGRDEWGAFLQGAYSFRPHWFGIFRYEHFDERAISGATRTLSLGLAWKPHPATIIKLERRRGDDNELLAPDGIFASAAVLF